MLDFVGLNAVGSPQMLAPGRCYDDQTKLGDRVVSSLAARERAGSSALTRL